MTWKEINEFLSSIPPTITVMDSCAVDYSKYVEKYPQIFSHRMENKKEESRPRFPCVQIHKIKTSDDDERKKIQPMNNEFSLTIDGREIGIYHWYISRYRKDLDWVIWGKRVFISSSLEYFKLRQNLETQIREQYGKLPDKNELGWDKSLITIIFYEEDGSLWFMTDMATLDKHGLKPLRN